MKLVLEPVEENYYAIPGEHGRHLLRGHFSLSDGGGCCVVAVVNPGIDWSAYIGAAPGDLPEDDALRYVARHGCKLDARHTLHFFARLWNQPPWRSRYRP